MSRRGSLIAWSEDRDRDGDGQLPAGRAVQGRVRETGVTPFPSGSSTMECAGPEHRDRVYSDRGYGVRMRRSSSTTGRTRLPPCSSRVDFDWAQILAAVCGWFHSGGIFASLSETTAPLRSSRGWRPRSRPVPSHRSTLNYWAKLWASAGGGKGQQLVNQIAGLPGCTDRERGRLAERAGDLSVPTWPPSRALDPDTVLRVDRQSRGASSQHQDRRDDLARCM